MTEPSETELIKRAQRGDRSAFEALLRSHYDAMYRMAYKWCGSQEDAQDITQTACIKLTRALGSFRFQSAFLTWLYPLVINTAKDWARARARHRAGDGKDPDYAEAPVAEQKVYANQVIDRIRALPEREREAVYLVFSEGLSHREAAQAMAKKLRSLRERESRHG
jgi:RNA polymerase sigma-70 factor (ECF subfamily)